MSNIKDTIITVAGTSARIDAPEPQGAASTGERYIRTYKADPCTFNLQIRSKGGTAEFNRGKARRAYSTAALTLEQVKALRDNLNAAIENWDT